MSAATYSYGPYYTFKATYKSHYCELIFHYYLFVCFFTISLLLATSAYMKSMTSATIRLAAQV